MIRNALEIKERHLSYVPRLEPRELADISGVVVHCTELPDLETAREYGERIAHGGTRTGNSGHYYVDRDGHTECWVPPERIAHHVRGRNRETVGIELVNLGRFPDWFHSGRQAMEDPYPDAQITALQSLIAQLRSDLPALEWVAGHEELDTGHVPASDDASQLVRRKLDPGPMFPWAALDRCGLRRGAPDPTD